MPISHQLKTIFIHIPKNAGESIEMTLGMLGNNDEGLIDKLYGIIDNRIVLQHLTAEELKNQYIPDSIWESYFKFAVIRNPWSKAVSEYNWFLRWGSNITFKEWVSSLSYRLQINTKISIYEIGHNIPQYKFITDSEGNIQVDKILKFENISNEFTNLKNSKSWEVDFLHYSESTRSKYKKDWRLYYCEETRNIISEIYQKDIEIFGYNEEETFKIKG